MNFSTGPDLNTIIWIAAAVIAVSILITLALVIWIILRIRRSDLAPNADFLTALRATPLVVVIVLDLLDFSLDIFSAPITWILLSYLKLAPLRMIAVVKDLIPVTNFIPLMTLAWLYARWSASRAIRSDATLPRLRQ
jgi:hypothetical protein